MIMNIIMNGDTLFADINIKELSYYVIQVNCITESEWINKNYIREKIVGTIEDDTLIGDGTVLKQFNGSHTDFSYESSRDGNTLIITENNAQGIQELKDKLIVIENRLYEINK